MKSMYSMTSGTRQQWVVHRQDLVPSLGRAKAWVTHQVESGRYHLGAICQVQRAPSSRALDEYLELLSTKDWRQLPKKGATLTTITQVFTSLPLTSQTLNSSPLCPCPPWIWSLMVRPQFHHPQYLRPLRLLENWSMSWWPIVTPQEVDLGWWYLQYHPHHLLPPHKWLKTKAKIAQLEDYIQEISHQHNKAWEDYQETQ